MRMKMKMNMGMAVLLGVMLALQSGVEGAEYFVGKQGNDANNGQVKEKAFLTIQKGINALKPGDMLTIGPGEYFENVLRANLGSPDVNTVIRAEISGTALLRGDVEVPGLQPVAGYRFVYAVAFDRAPSAVLEHDTLSILAKRPNMRDLEYDPGTFYYDEAQKKLYISTSDLREPGRRRYTAAVNGKSGLDLTNPRRVIIEGLAATGFCPGWGINLLAPVSCVVRGCITFMCEGGIVADRGSDNVIENCESYGHTFGGIVRYRADNDVIRNCRTYRTKNAGGEHFGIMHYFSMTGPLLIANNISWGQRFDYSVKPAQQERLVRNVALGSIRNSNMFNNLIGGENEYDRSASTASADNILFLREKNLNQDFEFADPLNLDFRLQADSRFRGTAPDKTDRGPYPYAANIFYVSPAGDDQASGLSMRAPWRTLDRALKGLGPGDTLYLVEGEYAAAPWNKAGDGKSPILIRGRGRGTVVITGKLNLTGAAGIVFERLNFARGAALADSREVTFRNCAFSGTTEGLNAESVKGLRLTHALFEGVPVNLKNSSGVYLSGNLYANAGKPAVQLDADEAILYSDYNSYKDAAACWQVAGAAWSFADLQKQHDRYSLVIDPQLSREAGAPVLKNAAQFEGRGPDSTSLGTYRELETSQLRLTGPFLHSVGETTANIEWWTSSPATFELAWGETPEMTNKVKNLRAPDCFTTFSLTGLKPGQTYYFKVLSADSSGRGTSGAMPIATLKPETAPLSFTTLAVATKPAVYYVAPDGDDARSGVSSDQAWRTVSHAADMVNAGDTVLIAGGAYKESVRIRATGDEGRPITFRCIPGEKVVFNGENLLQAFKIVVKKQINFDGFYFVNFGDSMGAVFVLWQGDRVQVTRCFSVKGTGNVGFISAEFSADVLVKNCVAAQGFSAARFHVCPGWRMENNLFLRPYISAVSFVNEPEQKGFFRKNIVTDDLPYKVRSALLEIGRIESFVDEDNCYFLRVPDEQRKMFMFYGTAAYARYAPEYGVTTNFVKPPVFVDKPDGTENNPRLSLKEYQALAGDTGSFVGDPKFTGTSKMEAGGKLWTGDPATMFDKLLGKEDLDFPDTFATDPRAVEKGIGPQPDDFKDFWFNKKK